MIWNTIYYFVVYETEMKNKNAWLFTKIKKPFICFAKCDNVMCTNCVWQICFPMFSQIVLEFLLQYSWKDNIGWQWQWYE